jgi:uncharacterized iron-regulated protein
LALAAPLAALYGATGTESATFPWEWRLRGDAIVLLGEVHDNSVQHGLRLEVLRRAFEAGWRPAIAMEQFDREHQADIERARMERPLDANYLIEQAATEHGKSVNGWNWDYYRPYVALALQYEVPLLAADLSRSDAQKIVELGYSAVFDAATVHQLGLDREQPSLLAVQENEIDVGHCHVLSKEQLPAMARAQLARDAVMAEVLREQAARGVVLLAGDGHARRDIGVPTWFDPPAHARVFAVAFLERGDHAPPASAFDAVVLTDAAPRPDRCATLRLREKS